MCSLSKFPSSRRVRMNSRALDGGHDRLRRLLRERRPADDAVVAHVGLVEASQEAGEADPTVLEEGRVLAGDDRLLHLLGDLIVGNHHPALVVELADQLLVAAPDRADDGRAVVAGPFDRGQPAGQVDVQAGQGDGADSGQDSQGDGDQDPQLLPAGAAVRGQPRLHPAVERRGEFVGHRSGPTVKHQNRGGSSWQVADGRSLAAARS
jgi:hypothetical protein